MNKIKQFIDNCIIKFRVERDLFDAWWQRRECKRRYPDWKDDEFNCGHNLFIWGVTKDGDYEASFHTWNMIEIYYNRASRKYYCNIDTTEGENNKIEYLTTIKKNLDYLQNLLLKTYDTFDDIYLGGMKMEGNNLAEVCARAKVLVNGYIETYKPHL